MLTHPTLYWLTPTKLKRLIKGIDNKLYDAEGTRKALVAALELVEQYESAPSVPALYHSFEYMTGYPLELKRESYAFIEQFNDLPVSYAGYEVKLLLVADPTRYVADGEYLANKAG